MADYTVSLTPLDSPVAQVATVPNYLYTTQAEIERLLSVNGASVRVDDYNADETPPANDASVQAAIWQDICIKATMRVQRFLLRFYETVDLHANAWVRDQATIIGAWLLSKRRGDPGLFGELYAEAIEELRDTNPATNPVPGLALRAEFAPAMSNIHVDDRFRLRKTRVEPTTSTGGTSARQDLDPDFLMEPFGR